MVTSLLQPGEHADENFKLMRNFWQVARAYTSSMRFGHFVQCRLDANAQRALRREEYNIQQNTIRLFLSDTFKRTVITTVAACTCVDDSRISSSFRATSVPACIAARSVVNPTHTPVLPNEAAAAEQAANVDADEDNVATAAAIVAAARMWSEGPLQRRTSFL